MKTDTDPQSPDTNAKGSDAANSIEKRCSKLMLAAIKAFNVAEAYEWADQFANACGGSVDENLRGPAKGKRRPRRTCGEIWSWGRRRWKDWPSQQYDNQNLY